MKRKYFLSFLFIVLCTALLTGCGAQEKVKQEIDESKDKVEEEKKDTTNYTSGITDIKEALKYELGMWIYNDTYTDYGMNTDGRVIHASTKELKAKDIKDLILTERLYQYISKDQSFDFSKVYTEEEVKAILQEFYGDNYTYNHKLTEQTACASLVYEEEKGGYVVEGGCGGMVAPSEPYLVFKILETTDTTVTLGRAYIVPTPAGDGYEAAPPYQIYTDENKTEQIGTLDSTEEIFTTLKDKVSKYLVTFDKDNGFYHFNNLKKIK